MIESDIPLEWDDLINEMIKKSVSIAYGVFDLSGKIIFVNDVMSHYLGTTKDELKPKNQFVNPDFDKIASFEGFSELVFEGVLTIGNLIDRVRLHYVVDMLHFYWIEFPVFNVADMYVTYSAILLMILLMTKYKNLEI